MCTCTYTCTYVHTENGMPVTVHEIDRSEETEEEEEGEDMELQSRSSTVPLSLSPQVSKYHYAYTYACCATCMNMKLHRSIHVRVHLLAENMINICTCKYIAGFDPTLNTYIYVYAWRLAFYKELGSLFVRK